MHGIHVRIKGGDGGRGQGRPAKPHAEADPEGPQHIICYCGVVHYSLHCIIVVTW